MSLAASRVLAFRDESLSPAALSAHLAGFARATRDAVIRSGEAPDSYATVVDGRRGASEDQVRPDGVILYLFNVLGPAVSAALNRAMALSPSRSGDYRRAWMIAVDGARWTGPIEDIPVGAEVTIVNSLPYARKRDVAAGGGRAGSSRILERVRQATMRQFPVVRVERTFVNLTAAFTFKGYETPYRLRGGRRRGEMTYPALVLKVRR